LVSGACFSEFGVSVSCVDQDAAKVAGLRRDADLRAGAGGAGGGQCGGGTAFIHDRSGGSGDGCACSIGLDGRIGRKFLHAGPGFGGSCFPKDCRALVRTADEAGGGLAIVETVLRVNEARKRRMADKITAACGGSLSGKSLAVLGLTFKPNTDDMRDAPSLEILPRLIAAGARIRAFDPEGMDEAKKLMPELVYCRDAYQTMEGADALILLTEWNEFRGLDLGRVRDLLASPLVIDLRNIYQPQEMAAAGFSYLSIGRPARRAARISGADLRQAVL
jgi:UDPglucose 6-dehydrogenase